MFNVLVWTKLGRQVDSYGLSREAAEVRRDELLSFGWVLDAAVIPVR